MSAFLSSIWKTSSLGHYRNSDNDDDFVVLPDSTTDQELDMPLIFRMGKCNNHNLYEISVDELQYLFSSASLTSVQYTEFCLARIQKVSLKLVYR